MLRVSDETRDRVMRIGRDEFGGASADETVRRLLDEHWQAKAVAAVRATRLDAPDEWAGYLAETAELAAADPPLPDEDRARR